MSTKRAINETLALLTHAGLANGPKTEEQALVIATIWETVLAEITDPELQAATVAYLRDGNVCQFWPQPGKILEKVPGRSAATVDTSDIGWGRLTHAVKTKGSYSPPGIDDSFGTTWNWAPDDRAVMEACVKALGGWSDVCALTYDDIPAARASFRHVYRAESERLRIDVEEGTVDNLLRMAGRAEGAAGLLEDDDDDDGVS